MKKIESICKKSYLYNNNIHTYETYQNHSEPNTIVLAHKNDKKSSLPYHNEHPNAVHNQNLKTLASL
jgi:hypothetical protein